MSIPKTHDQLNAHRQKAVQKLDKYLEMLINTGDPKFEGKADKLSYWLEDWSTFLQYETQFDPKKLKRYKRGEIIKVHLGFNVGSEEGGLHYAVVIDKENAKTSPVVTIVPLTSVKPTTDLSNLRKGNIFLGNELFTNLNSKVSMTNQHLVDELDLLSEIIAKMSDDTPVDERIKVSNRIEAVRTEMDILQRMRKEVLKMRTGSIALINQITTVSKIRIYDPKTDHDVLSHIKLSNEKLDLIDAEIIKNFTNYDSKP